MSSCRQISVYSLLNAGLLLVLDSFNIHIYFCHLAECIHLC